MRKSTMTFDDDYYVGICWIEPLGTLRLLDFKDMNGDELAAIYRHVRHGRT